MAEPVSGLTGARVVLVVPPAAGGLGRAAADEVAVLLASGADVVVAGPADTLARFGFAALGAGLWPLPIGERPHPARDAACVLALRRALRRASVVHAHGVRAGALGALALGPGRLRARVGGGSPGGARLLVTWHNRTAPGPAGELVATLAARGAHATLAVSPDLVELVAARGGHARWAPVGARAQPTTRPVSATRALLGAGSRPLVVCVARLHPQKGLDVLLAASEQWAQRRPRPHLVIAGDGPLRAQLAASPAVREGRAVLLGARTDIGDLLAAAQVVVQPSRWEGSPLAVHEALLAGRPVVATAVGGLPELVGDGARLVPADDPGALADAVSALLDDEAGRAALAGAGLRAAASWPGSQAAARSVAETIRGLLAAPAGPS